MAMTRKKVEDCIERFSHPLILPKNAKWIRRAGSRVMDMGDGWIAILQRVMPNGELANISVAFSKYSEVKAMQFEIAEAVKRIGWIDMSMVEYMKNDPSWQPDWREVEWLNATH